ncbi:MAG: hypothetical protein Q8779_02235 [Candidatus Phytoplasma stylosanthis]|uniref:hypothetical protein n=1 Tax=Candidatus Phytoplasma stylosanthis TaxID=2798314 RepID=UPI00293B5283|nr:hypothetical protein [Candidatus Phytoplasma stylosanthis]MDV3168064.1 hypothetical protein [Candidatus Phytoplasma stylosanthis]MDV3173850.1 hypothetical protein [Candidatus Phytoplasma stylosanthis]MDV3174369.1 hypothetical protein [Candidatus Phytoplasma stylosanthis]
MKKNNNLFVNIFYSKQIKLLIVIFIIFFSFFLDKKIILALEKKTNIHHIILKQPFPVVSREELVNSYTQKKLGKKIILNKKASYNADSNLNLNIEIKNPPTNLLGVYFDGGNRNFKDNVLTLEELRNIQSPNIKNIYFFYDDTDYCDIHVDLKFNENIYFHTFKKDWYTPYEWRPYFISYKNWRNNWYKKKKSNEKGYFLEKLDSQGFELNINVHEKDTLFHTPIDHVEKTFQNNNNFQKIKNFIFKKNLGNGIYVDYDHSKLIFQTNNLSHYFYKSVYEFVNCIPYLGIFVNFTELIEGFIQSNKEQIIDSSIDLSTSLFFGLGKLFKNIKNTFLTKYFSKITKKIEKSKKQEIFQDITEDLVIRFIKEKLSAFLKEKLIDNKKVVIELNKNTKITVIPENKPKYKIGKNDKVIYYNYQNLIN